MMNQMRRRPKIFSSGLRQLLVRFQRVVLALDWQRMKRQPFGQRPPLSGPSHHRVHNLPGGDVANELREGYWTRGQEMRLVAIRVVAVQEP